MCNRARLDGDPETLRETFGAKWLAAPSNRWPVELTPVAKGIVVREQGGERVIDAMSWDVLGGQAKWPMTNVRKLALPQWKRLAELPERRCLIPLTEFCEWTPTRHDQGDGKPPLKVRRRGSAVVPSSGVLATHRQGRRVHDGHL